MCCVFANAALKGWVGYCGLFVRVIVGCVDCWWCSRSCGVFGVGWSSNIMWSISCTKLEYAWERRFLISIDFGGSDEGSLLCKDR